MTPAAIGAQTEAFFTALFAPYQTEDQEAQEAVVVRELGASGTAPAPLRFELRAATPSGRWRHTWVAPQSTPATRVAGRFVGGDNLFISVCPMCGPWGGMWGNEARVPVAAFLWADVDGGTGGAPAALDLLYTAIGRGKVLPPHLLVQTGGGLHALWRLANPVPLETETDKTAFKRTLERLALAIGGTNPETGTATDADAPFADKGAAKLHFGIRVPGFFNRKAAYVQSGGPRPVLLLTCDEFSPVHPLVWWKAHLPALPLSEAEKREQEARRRREEASVSGKTDTGPLRMPPLAQTILSTPAAPHTRHRAATSLAASLASAKWPEVAIVDALETFATRNGWAARKKETAQIAFWAAHRKP